MPTGDQIIICHRCGVSFCQVAGHKCREPQPLPTYEAPRFISSHELIIEGIVAQCAEYALAQMSGVGGEHTFHYIDMGKAREIIRTSILTALDRHHEVVVSRPS